MNRKKEGLERYGLENPLPNQRHEREIGFRALLEKTEPRLEKQLFATHRRFAIQSSASSLKTAIDSCVESGEIPDSAEREKRLPFVSRLFAGFRCWFRCHIPDLWVYLQSLSGSRYRQALATVDRMLATVEAPPTVTLTITRVLEEGAIALCSSRAGQTVLLPRASLPRAGDQVTLMLKAVSQDEPVENEPNEQRQAEASAEKAKESNAGAAEVLPWTPAEFCLTRPKDHRATVVQTRVEYVPLPRPDKNGDPGIRIPLNHSGLGLQAFYLPCRAIRDYFFVPDRRSPWDRRRTLYQELGVAPQSTFGDLNAAFRLRRLELQRQEKREELTALERVYNLLAIPPLRIAYDELLLDPDKPVDFPGAGFGTLIVGGTRRADTFFVERILAFRPERVSNTFAVPFRKIEFCVGYAVIHDPRQKKEIFMDPHSLCLDWDPTWNQWRSYIGRQIQISAECIRTGRYRKTAGAWDYSDWYTALPSRTAAVLPDELREDIVKAQKAHHRFGRFERDIEVLREKVQRHPIEAAEAKRLAWDRGLPGDFDMRLIIWKPEFEEFFYVKLKQHATAIYLWREEFIFELEHVVVVEIPQAGRASYVFRKPAVMKNWLASYTQTSRAEIRKNQGNVAEILGFVGRVVHGRKPQNWWRELLARTGEIIAV